MKKSPFFMPVAAVIFFVIAVLVTPRLAHYYSDIKGAKEPESFEEIVKLCQEQDSPDSVLTLLAAAKLPNDNLCPMVFWKDGDYERAERFNKKYRHEYKEGITRIRRIVKEGSTEWNGKENLWYDITVTPGHKYIEVSKIVSGQFGFDTTNEWFIRWSGR